jgi:dihydrofolate reductase
MRRIIASENVTLDGFFAGPNGEIDMFTRNEETAQYARDQTKSRSTDTVLFGRVTYDLMASFWTTPAAASQDPAITNFMNNTPKIVFSKTLKKADWKNTRVIKDLKKEEILKIKQQSGKDMIIFGSGSIVSALAKLCLIDEYLIFVYPIILGSGKPLFKNLSNRIKLKLLETKTFKCGVVILHYEVEKSDRK